MVVHNKESPEVITWANTYRGRQNLDTRQQLRSPMETTAKTRQPARAASLRLSHWCCWQPWSANAHDPRLDRNRWWLRCAMLFFVAPPIRSCC